ncbi:MAG: serpin family protein, partial [Methanomassiliicoccales archaeon]
MDRNTSAGIGIVVLGAVILALAPAAAKAQKGPARQEVSPEMKALAAGQNTFALDLYSSIRGQKGNLFFSPYSISNALTMTWAGAAGPTAGEMASVLHLPGSGPFTPAGGTGAPETPQPKADPQAWRTATIQAAAALQKRLNAAGAKGGFQLAVANALWGQKGYPFKQDYLALINENFGGGLQQVDFHEEPAARAAINRWVEQQT